MPVMSSVGVVTLPTDISEECDSHSCGSSQNGFLKKLNVNSGMSVWPAMLIQSITGQRTAAAAKRLVCPITQLESTPPARAPRHVQACGVHVAATDHRVHPGHEVVEVGSRIIVVDAVGECVAVPGAAARVGVEHHVAVRG